MGADKTKNIMTLSSGVTQPLLADVQYFELYSSSAINRKLKNIVLPGFYCGFEPVPGAGLSVRITSENSEGKGAASVDVNNVQISVQQIEDVIVSVKAGATNIIVLEANFEHGVKTTQVDITSSVSAARIYARTDNTIEQNQIELCRVIVPSGATAVTKDMIVLKYRVNRAVGVEFSNEINSTEEKKAATPLAVKTLHDLVDTIETTVHNHLSVSTCYSVTEANRLLQALRINSGQYEGLWRYLNTNGGINWYFLFLAVYESEGKCFSLSDRMTICEKALRLGLVVPFMTSCRYEAGQRLTINGTLFFVNIAGTTGETLPNISSVAPGDFVRTGSAVLECLKSPSNRIPAAWQYFFLDVAPDLHTPVAPDSTDSYPALWFACIAEFADSAWLQEPSGIGGFSRWDIIKQVANFNVIAEINPVASLVNAFQHNRAPGDRAYAQCFCQDNAEVYAGLRALKTLADLAGDATAATEYTAAMKTIRAGLLALFVPEQKRFLTYYNEKDYPAEPSEGRFVDKDRFSVAPWRFGVLGTQEVEQYGKPVLDAIQSAYPDLFTANYAGIDTFAMSDFFAFVAKVTTSQTAATTAIRRLQIRATSAVTVADIAAAISVTAWGKIPQFRAGDFIRINGRSVLGGGDITLGAAATMEAQSDIYDRTEGRLAIPGAFGVGHIFATNEIIRFSSENDFLEWVRQAAPGEYIVDGSNKIIPGNVLFSGIVSIRWIESRYATPSPVNTAKAIIFYGINGHIYYNRYWTSGDGYLIGWESLKVNESDLKKLIATKAPLESPALTGVPTAPTAAQGTNNTQIATTAYVRTAISALVGSSPEALDTLNELAAALGNDPNFATTMTNALAGKQPLDATLTALAGLATGANKLPYFTGKDTVAQTDLTSVGRDILAKTSALAVIQYLGLRELGTSGEKIPLLSTANTWSARQTFNGGISGALTGNADTATKLQTARTINGVSFDGSQNIELTAEDLNLQETVNKADNAVQKTGDTLSGGLTFENDSILAWIRNTDWAKIGFKNDADSDADSFMWFETGDNGNEYFKWRSKQGTTTKDLMNLKWDALYILVNAIVNGEVISKSANGLRIAYGNYGFFIRNDGSNTYFMLTNSGDNMGTYNGLRPLWINNSTGAVSMGRGLSVSGETYSDRFAINSGNSMWVDMRKQNVIFGRNAVSNDSAQALLRQDHTDRKFMIGGLGNKQFGIYMINNSRTANGTDGQAYMDNNGNWLCGAQIIPGNYGNFDSRYQAKNTASKAANGWHKDVSTGIITQWGYISNAGAGLTFPIAFPSTCASITITNAHGRFDYSITVKSLSRTGATFNSEGNGNMYWTAIGY